MKSYKFKVNLFKNKLLSILGHVLLDVPDTDVLYLKKYKFISFAQVVFSLNDEEEAGTFDEDDWGANLIVNHYKGVEKIETDCLGF